MGAEMEEVRSALPEAAKDIRLNLQSVLQGGPLTVKSLQEYQAAMLR